MMDKKNVCVCIQYTPYVVNDLRNTVLLYLNEQAYNFFLSISVASFSSMNLKPTCIQYSVQTVDEKIFFFFFFK